MDFDRFEPQGTIDVEQGDRVAVVRYYSQIDLVLPGDIRRG